MGERVDEQHYAKDYGNVAIGAGLTLDDQLDTQQTLALLVDSISNGYDGSGRLRLSTKTSADGSITMTSRNYDGLNRVVTYDDGTNVLQYTYNADDTVARLDVGTSSYNVYTYDTVGNLRSQTSKKTSNNNVLGTYDYTYVMGASGYQQKTIAATANGHTNTTTYDYDFRGQLTRVDNPSESTKSYFAYSTDGKIATKLENATGSTPSQTIERSYFFGGNILGDYKSVDGVVTLDFGFNDDPISDAYPSMAPGTYIVNAGDTLQSVAQAVYGDQNLWYLIADANGLGGGALVPDQMLRIPKRCLVMRSSHPRKSIRM